MPYYYPIKSVRDKEMKSRLIERLHRLRKELSEKVPAKTAGETLLLATWNIREFGGNRSLESLYYIAEIISRFDLVAIQEVSADLKGLEKVISLLGPSWEYIVTDSTDGSAGGGERMAFVYDKNAVKFKNMAGELVLPKEKLIDGLQFARTPFCAAFQANWFKFKLATVHIYYGTSSPADKRRVAEIDSIAAYLAKRSDKEEDTYILLGDFNIVDTKGATMQALEKNGFHIPEAIKEHPSDLGQSKHYDQIAFRLSLMHKMNIFQEEKGRAGAFDFTKAVYTEKDLEIYQEDFPDKQIKGKSETEIRKYYLTTWRTFQMSDHLPLWTQLKIDFSDEYLDTLNISNDDGGK
jgi:endonuclease/exonuclease/phosphatase family metal-dependent hydrolase